MTAPARQAFAIGLASAVLMADVRALDVETIRSIGGLPPHIVGLFEERWGSSRRRGGRITCSTGEATRSIPWTPAGSPR